MQVSESFRTSTATINYTYKDDSNNNNNANNNNIERMIKQSSHENNNEDEEDATLTIHEMHRKLLHAMSYPQCFHDAIDWISKVESSSSSLEGRRGGLEYEKEDGTHYATPNSNITDDNNKDTTAVHHDDPPLPLQIFAPDAEVVLPEAMTANQLFGIERVTGIELEAAAGIGGLSLLFLRWLALMPEGDHMNIIDPPGLTVMRIAGRRYRVTGSHRVVWRWMNKFPPNYNVMLDNSYTTTNTDDTGSNNDKNASDTTEVMQEDTDFDFGDLVTMTVIDVFETDQNGKLLSYCPTFDNRAVHKTQEVVERVRKGASHLMDRVEVVRKNPASQKAIKAASHFSMKKYTQAITVGNILKHKIEEEIHKRNNNNNNQSSNEESSLDAVAGTDVGDDQDDVLGEGEESNNTQTKNNTSAPPALDTISSEVEKMGVSGGGGGLSSTKSSSKNDYYLSDDSTAGSSAQPTQRFV